jgi:putative tricarboxylic transport membrane protein
LVSSVDNFMNLLEGFAVAAQPMYLLFALGGVLVGTAVGVLPGIGPAMTVALLMPITYSLEPTAAIIVFAGIYYGGMYGGSTTSILLNTPGESSSIVTALEGNKMAKAGRGAAALATAAVGSFIAGTIATVLLSFVAPVCGGVRRADRARRVRGADGRCVPDRRGAPWRLGAARASPRSRLACSSPRWASIP